jgi:Ni/Co efflux regulator RcnB
MEHPQMNKQALISAVAAAVLALGSIGATAQPRDEQQRHGQDDRRGPQDVSKHSPQKVDKHYRNDARDRNGHDRRDWDRHDRRDRSADRRGPPPHRHAGERGAGPRHDFYRGDRLPPQYRTRYYVVDNWRAHRLSPPPRGYYWVQTGADYVLIGIATGIIAQIVLGQ